MEEPGADLAVALAVASAHPAPPCTRASSRLRASARFGLTGELRRRPRGPPRRGGSQVRARAGAGTAAGGGEVQGLESGETLADALRAAGAKRLLREAA